MKDYWVCSECEAVNTECNSCGKATYSVKSSIIKNELSFIDYPKIKGFSIKNFLLYPLIFLSNLIIKNYKKRLLILIAMLIFLIILNILISVFLYKSKVIGYLIYYYK